MSANAAFTMPLRGIHLTEHLQRAIIREEACIGCAKCIQACPVDAILGAAKHMHTVITDECIGCELCVAPCPVDCITMDIIAPLSDEEKQYRTSKAQHRFSEKMQRHKQDTLPSNLTHLLLLAARKTEIQAAVARVKAKKRART